MGVTSEFEEGGDRDLTEIVGALISVTDIWSGLTSVETDHGVEAGAAAAGRDYWKNPTSVGDIWPKPNVC